MQKARRHAAKTRRSDRLRAHGFRIYFTLLLEVLFTFPSRYLSTIGLSLVFSLAGWSRQIHTGLHVPRATQDTASRVRGLAYGAVTLRGRHFQSVPLAANNAIARSYNPRAAGTARVWAHPLPLAATRGIIVIFLSSGY